MRHLNISQPPTSPQLDKQPYHILSKIHIISPRHTSPDQQNTPWFVYAHLQLCATSENLFTLAGGIPGTGRLRDNRLLPRRRDSAACQHPQARLSLCLRSPASRSRSVDRSKSLVPSTSSASHAALDVQGRRASVSARQAPEPFGKRETMARSRLAQIYDQHPWRGACRVIDTPTHTEHYLPEISTGVALEITRVHQMELPVFHLQMAWIVSEHDMYTCGSAAVRCISLLRCPIDVVNVSCRNGS